MRRNYLHSLEKGFLKVASKMGISTAMGYRGAQIFETIGLASDLVDRYFTGTPARLCGIGLAEIEADILRRHRDAYADPAPKLADLGFVRYRKDGEPHAFEPPTVKLLQEAVNTGSNEAYRAYRDHVAQHAPTAVRDLMRVCRRASPYHSTRSSRRRPSSSASSSPRCRSARSVPRRTGRWPSP